MQRMLLEFPANFLQEIGRKFEQLF